MYRNNWRPSKSQRAEFAQTMDKIREFCSQKNISYSRSMDSYYFVLNGINYRVSNHTIESSNARAKDEYGNVIREKYHQDKRNDTTIYIHAGKTRIIEIYSDLEAGFKLDGCGRRI